jgi:hypothetical protein
MSFIPKLWTSLRTRRVTTLIVRPVSSFDSLRVSRQRLIRLSTLPLDGLFSKKTCGRCLVHVFPYAILYSIEAKYVLIVAVMHLSREPGYWRHRIGHRP